MTLLTKPEEREFEVIEFEDDEQDVSESEKTLQSVFSTLTDNTADVLVKVYRINEMGREAHCFDCAPDDMEGIEDRLREAYGKGDYRLKAYAPTGEYGRKSIKRVVKLAIETPLQPEKPKDTTGDLRTALVEMQRANTESQMNMMHLFKEQQLESQNRMTENQMRMQELLIQAMGNKGDQLTLTEQLAALKQLQPEQKDPMEMMEFMFTMNDRFQERTGPGESTPLGELSSGINSLVKLAAQSPAKPDGSKEIKAQPQQAMIKPGIQAEQPGQPLQLKQPLQPPQTMDDMNLNNPFIQAKLREQLRGLMVKAEQDKNPEVYAYLIVEELPPQFYPLLIEAVGHSHDEALTNIAAIEPGIMKHADWFAEFAEHIRDMFNEAEQQAGQQINEPGLNDEVETGHNSDSLDSNLQSDVITTTEKTDNSAGNESDTKGNT